MVLPPTALPIFQSQPLQLLKLLSATNQNTVQNLFKNELITFLSNSANSAQSTTQSMATLTSGRPINFIPFVPETGVACKGGSTTSKGQRKKKSGANSASASTGIPGSLR
jgi:hypothetical protein